MPQVLCDNVSAKFKHLFDQYNVGYTDYIRTTEQRHKRTVQYFWKCLSDKGHIYKGQYEGWYSTSDEAYLTNDQVTEVKSVDGRIIKVAIDSGNAVEWMKEDNYIFGLSELTDPLIKWLDTNPVTPAKFCNQVRSWVQAGLPDLSVSRPSSRLQWGIPVPGDSSQVIYVWLDALVNYLTVCGYPSQAALAETWPLDCQVIGKDILRFHAIYWPAFLIAAGLEPPRKIVCHSHWLMSDSKMSKSKGNVVDPLEYYERYTVDGMRYYLLRDGVPHSDGNFNDSRLTECLNTELSNTLGNLLNRCTSKSINPNQVVPIFDEQVFSKNYLSEDENMIASLKQLPGIVKHNFDEYTIYKALDAIMHQLRLTNNFLQKHKIWELAKQPEQEDWHLCVISVALETLRVCGILLQPTVPQLADVLLSKLGVETHYRGLGSNSENIN